MKFRNAKGLKYMILSSLLIVSMGMTGCGRSASTSSSSDLSTVKESPSSGSPASRTSDAPGFQLEKPAKGEEIAVLHTSMGDVSIRLFPNSAPKAVENFIGLVNKGYYNNLTFHRVMKDFMIQGGDPTATGTGGKSLWEESFEDEFNTNLLNLNGALSMANSGPNTNGSQFFVVQSGPENFSGWEYYEQTKEQYKTNPQFGYDTDAVPDDVRALYTKYGGACWLDGAYNALGRGHTVFGQVFDGMRVVEAIASVSVDGNNKPMTDVVIQSAEITTYTG